MSIRFESAAGLVVEANANGSIRRLLHGDVVLNLFPGTEIEGGPLNLYLRRLEPAIVSTPLLGPRSPLAFAVDEQGLRGVGTWEQLRVEVVLVLAASATQWTWHVALENRGAAEMTVDLVYAHDVGLAQWGAIRMNEYYVSQYLDHAVLDHPERGHVIASRQNLSMGGRYPWQAVGSLDRAVGYATDALQLHGFATRAGDAPAALAERALPSVRRQHEHAMAVLQDASVRLAPGATVRRGFWGWYEADHPAATAPGDAAVVERALAVVTAPAAPTVSGTASAATLFSTRPHLACRDLTDAEIAAAWPERRHVERDETGRPLSFFTGADGHVALRAKDLAILRPHGQLFHTGDALVPDEAALTTTAYMAGVFNALVTQGHVSINRFLSTTRSYLSLQRAHGQRVFVELTDGWHLLDVPSAWESTPMGCRWLYVHAGGRIAVTLAAATDRHALDLTIAVEEGAPARFLVTHHVALGGDDGLQQGTVRAAREGDGIAVSAPPDTDVGRRFPTGTFRVDPLAGTVLERVGGDELLFADGRSRAEPYLVLGTAPARSAGVRITATLLTTPPATLDSSRAILAPLRVAAGTTPAANAVGRVAEVLPWFVHDALIHYLAPRGLEQYSGGGWGTRDVCQGPVELLLGLGRTAPVRDLLLRVFANQNPNGDWPQWFMFFDRERNIRPDDSHGDIVFWPLLALARYLLASDDAALLDATVPFFSPDGDARAEHATVWAHVERAFAVISARLIPGTRLVAYGHGDWNDSLQPADPAMRERLCSTWTVTLHHQTLTTLAAALRRIGRADTAAQLAADAAAIRAEFEARLFADGVLAGFAYFNPDGRVDHLLHPRDAATGIHYRLLPMIHAIIADMLTPEQATAHVALMRTQLLGADGARLFDYPPVYRGGPQTHFQRAEASSYFGREIGLMYTHAHLRYAEAMARLGDAEAFFAALQRAHPIELASVVPSARRRQANCYYSSSDAVVADRYEAAARYADVRAGRVPYEGGWRVYSSGAGIAVRLVHEHLLGIRQGRSVLEIDPVVPKSLDGLRAEVAIAGRAVTVRYRVAASGHAPSAVVLNGRPLPFTRTPNPYRTGGVEVPMAAVEAAFAPASNELVVDLG